MKKKLLLSGFALTLAALTLVGCGSKETPGANVTPSPTPTAAPANVTPTPAPTPDPEAYIETPMNLNGRVIKMASSAANRYNYNTANKDNTSNETLAVMDKLREIEKDYNCTIIVEEMKGNGMVEKLVANKAAGDTPYDLLEVGVSDTQLQDLYTNNIVLPVVDAKIVNIIKPDENPWLAQSGFSTMYGTQYGVHFKTSNSGDLLRGTLVFNKDLATKYGLADFYSMVKDKTWTWENFEKICAEIVAKSNGEVVPLTYGHEGVFAPLFVFSNNGVYTVNSDNGYQFVGNTNENTLAALNFIKGLVEKGYVHSSFGNGGNAERAGAAGSVVFIFNNYETIKKYTRQDTGFENDYTYGILPAPLGPNGTEYGSTCYTDAIFHVMNNIQKPEEAAAILVAMANRISKKQVDILDREAQYALQDTESIEMLEILLNNVQIDVSRCVSTARSTIVGVNKSVLDLSKTPKQAMDEIVEKIQGEYDSIKVAQ